MSTHVKVAGHWKESDARYIKSEGVWKNAEEMEKYNGHWVVAGSVLLSPKFSGAIPNLVPKVGEPFMLDVSLRWASGSPPTSYTLHNAPTGMVISATGILTWPTPIASASATGVTIAGTNTGGESVSNAFNVQPTAAMIFTLHTDGNATVALPITDPDTDIHIDWGDGHEEDHTGRIKPIHQYGPAGDYDVSISGHCPVWKFHATTIPDTTALMIAEVKQWGAIGLESCSGLLAGCQFLKTISATDNDAFSHITDFTKAFYACSTLTALPLINTSSGTDFTEAFSLMGLKVFPHLNLSNGVNFTKTWFGSSVLVDFPAMDFSSGENFTETWKMCMGMTAFPAINTSSGSDFTSAWEMCMHLVCMGSVDTTHAAGKTDKMFDNILHMAAPTEAERLRLTSAAGLAWTNPNPCPSP